MGNNIILCEGETDQALLGCYLEKTAGWTFFRSVKNNPFPVEPICWYTDKEGYQNGIWQVGGNDFKRAIQSIARREQFDHFVDGIVIITDHDDNAAETDRLMGIKEWLAPYLENHDTQLNLVANQWTTILLKNAFATATIQFLYLLVPMDEYGALETFMMNALAEQSIEKQEVINQSRMFVNNFQSNYYLKQRRERVKAELGVSLSIFNPDRVFTTMKELIDSVEWERFSASHKQFVLLSRL